MTNENAATVLNLDELMPKERAVVLAGERIDVSKIPSRVTIELTQKAKILQDGSDESFPLILEMVAKICKPSKPDITTDWIIDNTSMDQLLALIEFVMQPMKERATKAANSKN